MVTADLTALVPTPALGNILPFNLQQLTLTCPIELGNCWLTSYIALLLKLFAESCLANFKRMCFNVKPVSRKHKY